MATITVSEFAKVSNPGSGSIAIPRLPEAKVTDVDNTVDASLALQGETRFVGIIASAAGVRVSAKGDVAAAGAPGIPIPADGIGMWFEVTGGLVLHFTAG